MWETGANSGLGGSTRDESVLVDHDSLAEDSSRELPEVDESLGLIGAGEGSANAEALLPPLTSSALSAEGPQAIPRCLLRSG